MSDFVLPLLGGHHDVIDGGDFYVSGIARKESSPGRYRVRLFDKRSGRLIREAWSSDDGAFSFNHIAYREYFILMHDHLGDSNIAAFDSVFPVPQ